MDWVRWAFGNPFSDGPGMLTLTLILRALSAAFAGFLRKRRGLGVAMFAAMIGSFGFFVIFTLTHRFGPLSLLGLAMMFALGLFVAPHRRRNPGGARLARLEPQGGQNSWGRAARSSPLRTSCNLTESGDRCLSAWATWPTHD